MNYVCVMRVKLCKKYIYYEVLMLAYDNLMINTAINR
jgi:hypothetical protein